MIPRILSPRRWHQNEGRMNEEAKEQIGNQKHWNYVLFAASLCCFQADHANINVFGMSPETNPKCNRDVVGQNDTL